MMVAAPRTKLAVKFKSPRRVYDSKQDKTIEIDVANVFRMLSAYFIVAATITPPIA
jgi:hypothetical protein